jgi:hypothetical protein
MEKMKRKEMIKAIDEYYKSINRVNPPKFREYSNDELRQTIILFGIKIKSLDIV